MKEKTYVITVEDIPITVTKKRMKHMYLRIKKEDGSVCISAPHQVSRERIYRFAAERIDWIRTYQEKYKRESQEREEKPELTPAELKLRKEDLKRRVEELVKKWEPVMQVGVSGITIRQMKTRWGSCNVRTCHININLALDEMPEACLEYVVVHEMTHILEPSHNAVFWGYMTQFYPAWKQVRSYLNGKHPD